MPCARAYRTERYGKLSKLAKAKQKCAATKAARKNTKMLDLDDFEIIETVVPASENYIQKTITDLVEETLCLKKAI